MERFNGIITPNPEPSRGKSHHHSPRGDGKGSGVPQTWIFGNKKWRKRWKKESGTCPGQQQEGTRTKQGHGSSWDSENCVGAPLGVWGVSPPNPNCSHQEDMEGTNLGLIWPILSKSNPQKREPGGGAELGSSALPALGGFVLNWMF